VKSKSYDNPYWNQFHSLIMTSSQDVRCSLFLLW